MENWIPVTERMPEPGSKVLITYLNSLGNRRTVCGWHAPEKYFEAASESEIAEYDEATDNYYDPAGWYESIDNWEDYSHVVVHEGQPSHWMPLPEPPNSPN